MKYIGYVFTKDQPIVEFNIDKFDIARGKIGDKGYEYIQTFNGNDIVGFNTIVVEGVDTDRLDIVRGLYGIYPWQIRIRDGVAHAIFRFLKPITRKNVIYIAECMSEMFMGTYQFHTFYEKSCDTVIKEEDAYSNPLTVTQYFDDKHYSDTINHSIEQYINDTIKISEIQTKLSQFNLVCDDYLNVAIGFGKPFYTVYKCLGFSLSSTYQFFNEHYTSGFKGGDLVSTNVSQGVVIKTTELIEHDGGLAILDEKMGYKIVTDFIIRVHYKLNKPDGEVGYIVILTNKYGESTSFIEWKNSANEGEMIRFVQSYGNYHFTTSKASLKAIHTAIANTEVPVITTFTEYGINSYKGERVLILPDGVMNVASKRIFLKEHDDSYLTFGGKDAIQVSGTAEYVDNKTMCRFSSMTEHGYDSFMNITKSIYGDLSGDILPMMACSMAGYTAYESYIKEAPLYFVTGVSGSGKSTFAEILGLMFGVSSFLKLSSTTVYPLKCLLSSGIRLPIFLSEYRSTMSNKPEKEALIRETFDGGEIQRGQRDGKINKYKLSAQLFIEGEDMYSSGSIRTRTIIHRTSAGGRKKCKPQEVISKNRETISSFFYSYLVRTNQADYTKHIDDAYVLFKDCGAEPRIISNMQVMYAGCMCFAPDKKEYFIEQIIKILAFQIQDFQQNSVTKQFLKVMGQYIGSKFARYYTDIGYTYFNWNDIIEFCEKNRKVLDNSLDSYRSQLVEYGFESDFFEVETRNDFNRSGKTMIDGVRIRTSKLPKELLSNPELFSEYKIAINKE